MSDYDDKRRLMDSTAAALALLALVLIILLGALGGG
jgi:hypothetical protein